MKNLKKKAAPDKRLLSHHRHARSLSRLLLSHQNFSRVLRTYIFTLREVTSAPTLRKGNIYKRKTTDGEKKEEEDGGGGGGGDGDEEK